jgi:uncharacterized protein YoxC
MDWNVTWLGVIALSMVIFSISVMVAVTRLLPLLAMLKETTAKLDRTLDRLQAIGQELELITGRVRRVEERIATVVDPLLDQTLPPIRGLTAVLAGVRTGLGALARGREKSANSIHS